MKQETLIKNCKSNTTMLLFMKKKDVEESFKIIFVLEEEIQVNLVWGN